jgi:hypothetical protein
MQQQPQLVKLNIKEVMAHMTTRKEIYDFLTLNGEAYLPKIESINVFFLQ